ncbi:MAG: pre-16S rRNA-processing nuclease YqgF [Thermosynechococcaceae cyanobacterium]
MTTNSLSTPVPDDLQRPVILGFDPGRDKCGVAVMGRDRTLYWHEVVRSEDAIATLQALCNEYPISHFVIGNQTTSKQWQQRLQPLKVEIVPVDERNSTLEARDRYWQMYPVSGLARLWPQGLRTPPRPIDDIVAILLIERYLDGLEQC